MAMLFWLGMGFSVYKINFQYRSWLFPFLIYFLHFNILIGQVKHHVFLLVPTTGFQTECVILVTSMQSGDIHKKLRTA